MYKDFNLYELIVANISRTIKDEEVGFTGLVTGDETAIFASMIPLAAMSLAQHMHAPNMTILLAGMLYNPNLAKLDVIPDSECDPMLAYSDYEGIMLGFPPPWCCDRGDISFGFSSAAQMDPYGNMNSVCIGEYKKPKVRLVGAIFQTEHLVLFGREIVMMPHHDRRNFVEKVDFVSAVGYPGGLAGRRKLGLERGGPELVLTNKCIMDFEKESGRLRLKYIHPGVTKQDIIESTGFELLGVDEALPTPEPTEEELAILRTKVDPKGLLIPRGDMDKKGGNL